MNPDSSPVQNMSADQTQEPKRYIKVSFCGDCPACGSVKAHFDHRHNYPISLPGGWCTLAKRPMTKSHIIQEWCPLKTLEQIKDQDHE